MPEAGTAKNQATISMLHQEEEMKVMVMQVGSLKDCSGES